jgi:hypothetical protein
MRLNLATFAVGAATMLGAIGCGEGEATLEDSPGAPVTVTDMIQNPDGSWTTTTRTIPGGQTFRPDLGDGVEARQSALAVTPCSGNSVATYLGNNFSGHITCLTPTGTSDILQLPVYARSVVTITPIYLYDHLGNLIFFSCNNKLKFNGALPGLGTFIQEASQLSGVCHFL